MSVDDPKILHSCFICSSSSTYVLIWFANSGSLWLWLWLTSFIVTSFAEGLSWLNWFKSWLECVVDLELVSSWVSVFLNSTLIILLLLSLFTKFWMESNTIAWSSTWILLKFYSMIWEFVSFIETFSFLVNFEFSISLINLSKLFVFSLDCFPLFLMIWLFFKELFSVSSISKSITLFSLSLLLSLFTWSDDFWICDSNTWLYSWSSLLSADPL